MNKILSYSVFALFLATLSCVNSDGSTEKLDTKQEVKKIDIQGHRGCRGLMPENTIKGFLNALQLGVVTLELDVVVTNDSLVIVSHEPWFSHEISLKPGGEPIEEADELNYNIFKMDYNQTQNFDVGIINHPRFPGQEKFNATKPLLSDVIESAIKYADKNNLERPRFNIEIKSQPEWDSIFTPNIETFVELVVKTINDLNLNTNDYNLQSFDFRVLQYLHQKYPNITLAVLTESKATPTEIIEKLGFVPQIYSPQFKLVNKELKKFCTQNNMALIPWTVNDISVMEQLIELEVDGIITDYPNIALSLLKGELM